MIITEHTHSPSISSKIKETINNIENPDEFILVLQLAYRDNNTMFHLEHTESINFDKDCLEIHAKNGSTCFYDYNEILEYNIIRTNDVSKFQEM